jgi:uncharacterized protein (TIGR03437 family)
LVTSPSDNSVRVVNLLQGTVVGTIEVGPQPHAVSCLDSRGAVSNLGDDSLVLFDVQTLTITARISGVPGSRGLHGVSQFRSNGGRNYAWVAGTDADVVTIIDVDLDHSIIARIPVSRPTAIFLEPSRSIIYVASAGANSILGYSPDTLQLIEAIQAVPNPRDIVRIPLLGGFRTRLFLDWFAASGMLGSVSMRDSTSATFSTLTDVPDASALAAATLQLPLGQVYNVVLVTSTASMNVLLLQPGTTPAPNQFAVSNAASFGTNQLAAGQLASLFAATAVSQNFFASAIPLPRALGGVSLRLGGTLTFNATTGNWDYSPTGSLEAPLVFVGPNQVNFQVPPGAPLGDAVPVQLTRADGSTLLSTVRITATAPGIFTVLQNGQGQAAVLNQDNQQNFGTRPAARGSVIQIYATGGGETTPPLLPGEAAASSGNPLVITNVQPTVAIGGVNAPVRFSGMAPGWVGLWQINVEVPGSVPPGSAVPLVVSSGGVTSNTATIAVE